MCNGAGEAVGHSQRAVFHLDSVSSAEGDATLAQLPLGATSDVPESDPGLAEFTGRLATASAVEAARRSPGFSGARSRLEQLALGAMPAGRLKYSMPGLNLLTFRKKA